MFFRAFKISFLVVQCAVLLCFLNPLLANSVPNDAGDISENENICNNTKCIFGENSNVEISGENLQNENSKNVENSGEQTENDSNVESSGEPSQTKDEEISQTENGSDENSSGEPSQTEDEEPSQTENGSDENSSGEPSQTEDEEPSQTENGSDENSSGEPSQTEDEEPSQTENGSDENSSGEPSQTEDEEPSQTENGSDENSSGEPSQTEDEEPSENGNGSNENSSGEPSQTEDEEPSENENGSNENSSGEPSQTEDEEPSENGNGSNENSSGEPSQTEDEEPSENENGSNENSSGEQSQTEDEEPSENENGSNENSSGEPSQTEDEEPSENENGSNENSSGEQSQTEDEEPSENENGSNENSSGEQSQTEDEEPSENENGSNENSSGEQSQTEDEEPSENENGSNENSSGELSQTEDEEPSENENGSNENSSGEQSQTEDEEPSENENGSNENSSGEQSQTEDEEPSENENGSNENSSGEQSQTEDEEPSENENGSNENSSGEQSQTEDEEPSENENGSNENSSGEQSQTEDEEPSENENGSNENSSGEQSQTEDEEPSENENGSNENSSGEPSQPEDDEPSQNEDVDDDVDNESVEEEFNEFEHQFGKPLSLFAESNLLNVNDQVLNETLLHPNARDRKIVVLSIVGAFRSGKSFYLDYCLRYLYGNYKSINYPDNPLNGTDDWMGSEDDPLIGFPWRSGFIRETAGVQIWSDVFLHTDNRTGKELAIVLMDSQGIFDAQTTSADLTKIFSLTTLMSSIQIFNLNDAIKEEQLQYLQLTTEVANYVSFENNGKVFQRLMFLIRDWTDNDFYDFGINGGKNYIADTLVNSSNIKLELQSVRKHIYNSFESVSCFLMPPPYKVVERGFTSDFYPYDGRYFFMSDEFVEGLKESISLMLSPSNLEIKKIKGEEMNGQSLVDFIKGYSKALQIGNLPNESSSFDLTLNQYLSNLINGISERYRITIRSFVNFGDAEAKSTIIKADLEYRKQALNHFDAEKMKLGASAMHSKYKKRLISSLDYIKAELIANVENISIQKNIYELAFENNDTLKSLRNDLKAVMDSHANCKSTKIPSATMSPIIDLLFGNPTRSKRDVSALGMSGSREQKLLESVMSGLMSNDDIDPNILFEIGELKTNIPASFQNGNEPFGVVNRIFGILKQEDLMSTKDTLNIFGKRLIDLIISKVENDNSFENGIELFKEMMKVVSRSELTNNDEVFTSIVQDGMKELTGKLSYEKVNPIKLRNLLLAVAGNEIEQTSIFGLIENKGMKLVVDKLLRNYEKKMIESINLESDGNHLIEIEKALRETALKSFDELKSKVESESEFTTQRKNLENRLDEVLKKIEENFANDHSAIERQKQFIAIENKLEESRQITKLSAQSTDKEQSQLLANQLSNTLNIIRGNVQNGKDSIELQNLIVKSANEIEGNLRKMKTDFGTELVEQRKSFEQQINETFYLLQENLEKNKIEIEKEKEFLKVVKKVEESSRVIKDDSEIDLVDQRKVLETKLNEIVGKIRNNVADSQNVIIKRKELINVVSEIEEKSRLSQNNTGTDFETERKIIEEKLKEMLNKIQEKLATNDKAVESQNDLLDLAKSIDESQTKSLPKKVKKTKIKPIPKIERATKDTVAIRQWRIKPKRQQKERQQKTVKFLF